jgi:hypothetical protein
VPQRSDMRAAPETLLVDIGASPQTWGGGGVGKSSPRRPPPRAVYWVLLGGAAHQNTVCFQVRSVCVCV